MLKKRAVKKYNLKISIIFLLLNIITVVLTALKCYSALHCTALDCTINLKGITSLDSDQI